MQFRANALLSGSSDGLISLSNPLEDDEDEAVEHVANWGCSVSQLGWIGDGKVWAASDMETFSTWTNEVCTLSNIQVSWS
jgi:WD repeat-containing protein 89